MITNDQLDIYERFRGDPDEWQRAANARDRELLSDHDWELISELIQELTLLRRDVVSSANAARIDERVRANSADARVAERLKAMALEL